MERQHWHGATVIDPLIAALGALRYAEIRMRDGEFRLQLAGAASLVDLSRLRAIGTVDLHPYAAQCQCIGPVQADEMVVADDGENVFGQQAAAKDMRFPRLGERGDGDQHGPSRISSTPAYQPI